MHQLTLCKSLLWIAAITIIVSCSKGNSSKPAPAASTRVITYAGTGAGGSVNGTGPQASFTYPSALAYSSSGVMFVGDFGNSLVREIALTDAAVTTYAGTGVEGLVNGPAASAEFDGTAHIVLDKQGDLFVSDEENNVIREITASGNVVTVAGSGAAGYQDGPAATAMFTRPEGLVVDANGDLYVAEGQNNVIRKITTSTAMVSTYAGTGTVGFNNGALGSATFSTPYGLTIDGSGNLYVSDVQNNCIREINVSTGMVSTYAGSGAQGFTNGPAATATFYDPVESIFDGQGNMYISDFGNNVIRKISTSGVVSTYAGNGTQGLLNGADSIAEFNHPIGLAIDGNGNLYIADERNNVVREITTAD
jgi:serine/threonine-protein kinase